MSYIDFPIDNKFIRRFRLAIYGKDSNKKTKNHKRRDNSYENLVAGEYACHSSNLLKNFSIDL